MGDKRYPPAIKISWQKTFFSIGLSVCLTVIPSAPLLAVEELSEQAVDSADALQEKVDRLYWEGDYSNALPIYKGLITKTGKANKAQDALTLHHLRDLGDCQAHLGQYEQAANSYSQIVDILKKHRYDKSDPLGYADALSDLAACRYYCGDSKKAQKLIGTALKLYENSRDADQDSLARLYLEMAEINYAESDYGSGVKYYEKAISLYDKEGGDNSEPLAVALEGLGACYSRLKNYQASLEPFKREAAFIRTIYGDTDIRYAWALLSLSGTYLKLGDEKTGTGLYEKCIFIFRKSNLDRIIAEEKTKGTVTPEIKERALKYIFGTGYKEEVLKSDSGLFKNQKVVLQCVNEQRSVAKPGPWNLAISGKIDPPGWVWVDPKIGRRAIVVCVHGLGLNGKSFDAFARQIAPRGFMTIAFDMRGFGTYIASKGKDEVDFAGCLDDLRAVLRVIRRDDPDVPLYLLGESMGGAIALQTTARNPELVDGLICSVPAGNRYKSAKTNFLVAFHLVKSKDRPFAIGTKLVQQATNKLSVREAWEKDPFNRLMLTPRELVHYQEFMNQNKAAAAKIKKTPVIVFQGYQDHLVKPEGTLQLFKYFATEDKDLVLSGTSEHLIFEEGQTGKEVCNGVVGWMLGHMPDLNASVTAATVH
jgi:acylglycerol lipase